MRHWNALSTRLRLRLGLDREWWLLAVAAGVGALMGVAAIAFIMPIRWLERLPERMDAAEPWMRQSAVLAAPVVGALLTGAVFWLVPSAFRGHGVSRVLYAVNRQGSSIPLRIGVRHWLASTFTIGSGGSAGPEGPIVTIGSTIGSNAARWLGGTGASMATLLGCGAAAGIASVFNAPMAGIFFTLEVILRDFSLRTFTPIVVASVVSAATTQTVLGSQQPLFGALPDFLQGQTDAFSLVQTPVFVALGMFCALPAVGFMRLLPAAERFFSRMRVPRNLRPAIGALMLALLGALYFWRRPFGELLPPFFGAGYHDTRSLLAHALYAPALSDTPMVMASVAVSLVFAGFVKAVATCLTLGSGGSGGMFAPSLLMGALTGGAFGLGLHAAGFASAPDPSQCALVGMAAMIAATAHAPLTGVLLVYELTHIPSVILPLMLTAVIATTMSRLLHRESIYTASLSVLGIRLGSLSDLTVLRRVRVADLDLQHADPVRPHEPASRLVEMLQQRNIDEFVVQDADGRYRGMVTSRDLRETLLNREIIPLLTVEELTRDDLPRLQPGDTLDMAMDRFSRHDVECLPVLDGARLLGLLSRQAMLKRYQLELEQAG